MSTALLNALMDSQYKARENPFGVAAQSLATNSGNLINPYGSVGSNAVAAIGSSLLAGLLAGVARSQTQSDNATLAPLQSEALSASPERLQEIVSQEPRLQSLAGALQAAQMEKAQALAQKQQELQLARENEIATYQAKAPLEIASAAAKARALAPIELDLAGKKASAEASAKARVEQDTSRSNTEMDKAVTDLRKELLSRGEVADYRVVERTAKAMANTLKDKGAPSDLELTRYSILLLEPGMAVREGEQSAVLKSASIPDQWKAQISKALEGKTALNDDVREGLRRLAARAYNETSSQYERSRQFYTGEAQKRGADPARVDVYGASIPTQELFPGVSLTGDRAQMPSSAATQTPSFTPDVLSKLGYVKVEGGWKKR